MCPSSGADDCVIVIASCWYVPWLQGGCQDRLAGSTSTPERSKAFAFRARLRTSTTSLLSDFIVVLVCVLKYFLSV